jgi:uncharacterized membrane protein
MKINKTIIKIVSILSLASVLLLWPITILSANSDIWFLLQKGNVSLHEQEIKMYNQLIISFFKGDVKELNFLTQDEMLHMQDVKILLVKSNMTFWFSLILFLMTSLSLGKNVRNIARKTSVAILSFLILIIILNIIDFNWIFLKFHEIFFTGNYAFPANSMLKTLYPDSFFRNVFILYFLLSILGCLAVMAASYMLKK